jgi:hypothetical protein
MMQKNHPHSKNKTKTAHKPVKTTTFKKEKTTNVKGACYTCGEGVHFARDCPKCADRKGQKASHVSRGSKDVNMATLGSTEDGYGNLFTILSVFQSMSRWFVTGANVHVCANISLFSSYQAVQGSSMLMGNRSQASVRGVGTIDLKFTSGKIMQLKNVQHVPTINKNLVSGSLLCKDGFKVVLDSNKLVMSKHGQFNDKDYDCGGLFRLSLANFCNKSVNHICGAINNDASVWHSRLCHVNFGLISQLFSICLIPNFTIAKGSKCHSCVQSKQPRKPHKSAEERNLAPLELIYSNRCEMNGVLTKGGKRYFMTLIYVVSRFC